MQHSIHKYYINKVQSILSKYYRIPFFLKAIHKTAGIMTQNESEQAVQQKIDEVFQEMDKNHDEKISLQEFIESASQDRSLISVLELNYDIQ